MKASKAWNRHLNISSTRVWWTKTAGKTCNTWTQVELQATRATISPNLHQPPPLVSNNKYHDLNVYLIHTYRPRWRDEEQVEDETFEFSINIRACGGRYSADFNLQSYLLIGNNKSNNGASHILHTVIVKPLTTRPWAGGPLFPFFHQGDFRWPR